MYYVIYGHILPQRFAADFHFSTKFGDSQRKKYLKWFIINLFHIQDNLLSHDISAKKNALSMIFKKCTEACKPFKSHQFCSVMGGLGQKEDNKYRPL